jgi:hypothetical protein
MVTVTVAVAVTIDGRRVMSNRCLLSAGGGVETAWTLDKPTGYEISDKLKFCYGATADLGVTFSGWGRAWVHMCHGCLTSVPPAIAIAAS